MMLGSMNWSRILVLNRARACTGAATPHLAADSAEQHRPAASGPSSVGRDASGWRALQSPRSPGQEHVFRGGANHGSSDQHVHQCNHKETSYMFITWVHKETRGGITW